FGHNGFLTAALLVPGVALMHRRPMLAGVLFGVLTFKWMLGPLVIVGLVAGRAWRATAVAIITALTLAAVATLLYGIESWTLLVTGPMSDQIDIMTAQDDMNVRIMASLLPRVAYLLDGSVLAY